MKSLFKKIKSKISVKSLYSYRVSKKFVFLPLLFLVLLGAFLIAKPALAWDPIADASAIFGWIIMQVVSVLGKILTWVISLLIQIAQYNSFITAPAVSKGWIIIRDLCNMFFIAALLLIAFGTVLKVEKYSYKRTLGGLLVAAVLINFSKLICGFFIDIAQILMLTFVNAFKDAAAGNFLQMLGMDKWLNFSGAKSGGYSAFTGSIFALILIVISLIVISIMMVILAFRIVIIWLLVVLSPLVFVLNIFPGKGQSYSNMWWDKFTNQLIVGPVMAFFIWLSFATASQSSIIPQAPVDTNETGASTISLQDNSISEAANPSNFAKFVVSITMLVGSLLIAQQLGVAGGKLAGGAVGKMQAYATGKAGVLKKAKDTGKLVAKGVAGSAGRLTGKTTGFAAKFVGKNIGKGAGWAGNKIDQKGKIKDIAQKGSAWAKGQSEASKDRLAQGKGKIWDHAVNNIGSGFKSGAAKEIAEGQAGQMKRVEDAKKRMVGKSKDQLTVINKTGTVSERQAAGVMMAESGQLKADSPENQQIIKDTQQAMKWNKPIRDSFNSHIKKNSDAGLVIDTQFNGLKTEADAKQLSNDISEGKVDAGKMVQELDVKGLDKLKKGFAAIGKDFGEIVMQSLSGKQLKDLRDNIGEERSNKLYEEYDPKGKNDIEQKKYVQATGRVDKLDNIDQFVKNNQPFVKNNINPESFSSPEVVENLMKYFGDKDIDAMASKPEDKKAILGSIEKLIKGYNTKRESNAPEAKTAREAYMKLNKGGSISDVYYEGTSEDAREEIDEDLTEKVSNGTVTMKHVAKLTIDPKNDNDKAMGMAIVKGMNNQKLKELAKTNGGLVDELKKLCVDLIKNGSEKEKLKAKEILGSTNYLEHLRGNGEKAGTGSQLVEMNSTEGPVIAEYHITSDDENPKK